MSSRDWQSEHWSAPYEQAQWRRVPACGECGEDVKIGTLVVTKNGRTCGRVGRMETVGFLHRQLSLFDVNGVPICKVDACRTRIVDMADADSVRLWLDADPAEGLPF